MHKSNVACYGSKQKFNVQIGKILDVYMYEHIFPIRQWNKKKKQDFVTQRMHKNAK